MKSIRSLHNSESAMTLSQNTCNRSLSTYDQYKSIERIQEPVQCCLYEGFQDLLPQYNYTEISVQSVNYKDLKIHMDELISNSNENIKEVKEKSKITNINKEKLNEIMGTVDIFGRYNLKIHENFISRNNYKRSIKSLNKIYSETISIILLTNRIYKGNI